MKPTREQTRALFERETVEDVVPSRDALERHLLSGKPFHAYLGLDPTADRVHLGHIQNILFLEDLRRIGAKVTLLFGSFTGLVGDPSGRDSARSQLSRRQVAEHARGWRRQISPVLKIGRFGGARVARNSAWFDRLSLEQFLRLMSGTTAQQLLERSMFQKRIRDGKPLYAHELVYPILQGYDSVALRVDAEVCGTDQTFNALMGRSMARRMLDKEKFVITMKLIQADGVMMSKSAGTGVFVSMDPGGHHRMFGGIMALPDGFILPLYRGCTRVPMKVVRDLDLRGGTATRDAKMSLASEIVGMFWGADRAREAEQDYVTQFREKGSPDSVPTVPVKEGEPLLSVVADRASISRSEARRRFAQGAVSLDGEKVSDIRHVISAADRGKTLRVGRKIFTLS